MHCVWGGGTAGLDGGEDVARERGVSGILPSWQGTLHGGSVVEGEGVGRARKQDRCAGVILKCR